MTVAYVIFVAGVLIIAAVGMLVYRTTPTNANWCQNLLGRFGRVRDIAVNEFGRAGGALAVLLATSGAMVIVVWLFGRFARRYVDSIDLPFLHWTERHVYSHGSVYHLNATVTRMGSVPATYTIMAIAAVVFAVLWARRGDWWIPPIVFATAFTFGKYGQYLLEKVVDRQATPNIPTLGTFPSGGCERIIVTYGLILYMVILTWPSIQRRWRIAGFTIVALGTWVEGYTRVYIIKHWGMDVIAGWIFGTLLLLSLIAATSCFKPKEALKRDSAVRSERSFV